MSAARIVITLACLWVAAGSVAAQAPAAPPPEDATQAPAVQPPDAAAAPTPAAQPPDPNAAPSFAGADSCKTCHKDVFDSWSQTKHARAINRLTGDSKQKDCINCHVTGSAEQIAREGATPTHPNVQCEACHGAGSLHVADATVMRGLAKKPAASVCEKCHNEKSPHYRGFVYNAMVGLSHQKR